MKPWLVPITVMATLEGLHWWSAVAAYVAAALIGGFCLGRIYEAGTPAGRAALEETNGDA